MVQTIKAYKLSWKQTLKAYKSNMGTNTKHNILKNILSLNKPKFYKCFKSKIDPWVLNQNNNLRNTARQNQEFKKTIENYK